MPPGWTRATKTGSGTSTLSGTASFTGPTTVTEGALALANARSLGDMAEVHLAAGATLDLNFDGEMHLGTLYLDGKLQPAGKHGASNAPNPRLPVQPPALATGFTPKDVLGVRRFLPGGNIWLALPGDVPSLGVKCNHR
ncbi:MAG: autotransporter-associated beta strand repeat-containing protein [Akkermansiaceae bacterium]|nr:autotransporter-associated beta strand repeat-containing protein [Akkermansiaceae bacterium]MCF7732080.1 autotransporter-associated beta strand repeat-containing protein [Akkermansiaceae bacterium]